MKIWKCTETGKLCLEKPYPKYCGTLIIRNNKEGKDEGYCKLKGFHMPCDAIECAVIPMSDVRKIRGLVKDIYINGGDIDCWGEGYLNNILDLLKDGE